MISNVSTGTMESTFSAKEAEHTQEIRMRIEAQKAMEARMKDKLPVDSKPVAVATAAVAKETKKGGTQMLCGEFMRQFTPYFVTT